MSRSDDDIKECLRRIDQRLDDIEKHLGVIKKDCSQMNRHIVFIENTYDIVRAPLGYLKSKIEGVMRVETVPLPLIKKECDTQNNEG